MKPMFLRNANFFFLPCDKVLLQKVDVDFGSHFGSICDFEWLNQPKTSHSHPLADAWSSQDVGPSYSTNLSSIYRVYRGSHDTPCSKQYLCQKWQNHAMAGLFSWFKSHRKSLDHPQEEGFSCGRQYMGKKNLRDAILTASKDISSNEIKTLTSSMDQRLFSLISNNGGYMKY